MKRLAWSGSTIRLCTFCEAPPTNAPAPPFPSAPPPRFTTRYKWSFIFNCAQVAAAVGGRRQQGRRRARGRRECFGVGGCRGGTF
eukprot:1755688-Prymnesium_polylepis.1